MVLQINDMVPAKRLLKYIMPALLARLTHFTFGK